VRETLRERLDRMETLLMHVANVADRFAPASGETARAMLGRLADLEERVARLEWEAAPTISTEVR
jgi:hypothetical protein